MRWKASVLQLVVIRVIRFIIGFLRVIRVIRAVGLLDLLIKVYDCCVIRVVKLLE
jgi:hypothetical protein